MRKIDKNDIKFRWMDIQREDKKDIVKANLIESLQKQADNFFPKINWRIT